MRRRAEGHQANGVIRSLRWALRGTLTVAGAALLGGAFTAAASADDSLVGGLLDGTGEVVEEATDIVESVAGATDSETSTVEVDEPTEQAESEAVEPVVETTEVVTEAVEPVAETTEVVTEAVEPVAETTEVVTEAVEPVAETTEVVTEAVEPVAETTEAPQERTDTDVAPTTQAAPTADGAGQDEQTEAESHAPERDSSSLLGEVTDLIDPITTQLDEIAEPVTGRVITPTVNRVAEGLPLPVVDDVVAPVVAPVLQDVVAPVVDPVVHSVLQDVVAPIAHPVVESVATDAVNPIVTMATGEPLPVLVESVIDTGYRLPVHVANASTLAPREVVTLESVTAAVSDQVQRNSGPVSSALVESSVIAQHFTGADSAGFADVPSSSGTAAPTEGPQAGETGGDTAPNLPVAPAPAPAPNTASNTAGQGSGAGYADVVGGLLMPANALTSQAAAEPLSSAMEVVLKVAVAPD